MDSHSVYRYDLNVAGAKKGLTFMSHHDPLRTSTASVRYDDRTTYVNAEHVALRLLKLHELCGLPSATLNSDTVIVDSSLRLSTIDSGRDELIALFDVLRAALYRRRISATDRHIWGMVRIAGHSLRGVPGHPKGRVESVLGRLDTAIDHELSRRGLLRREDR